MTTLVYLIAEHARLTILNIFSTLLALNRSCSLNYFEDSIHPARLLGPAGLIFQSNMQFYHSNFGSISHFFNLLPFSY